MTYNVHGCVGVDRQHDVARVAQVICEARPDVVALQELNVNSRRSNYVDQPRCLGELTGMQVHFSAARCDDRGSFGNATLSRFPYQVVSEGALPVRFGELRGAHLIELKLPDQLPVHFVNTHLSIHFYERWQQIKALFSDEPRAHCDGRFWIPPAARERLVVCGDFNAGSWSPVYRWLVQRLTDVQDAALHRAQATWPSRFPLFRLDHIWTGPGLAVERVLVPRSPLARVTSDHLPVVADLAITP